MTREHFDKIAKQAGLKIGPSTKRAFCATGEPVTTLTHAGIRYEGEFWPEGTLTEAEAWQRYEAVFRAYLAGKSGVLYWRRPPVAERNDSGWRVYSRLRVSELPRQRLVRDQEKCWETYRITRRERRP